MYVLIDWYEATRSFLEAGGNVLTAIAWVMLFMWILIVERFVFFFTGFRRHVAAVQDR